ncbi:MAG: hypothetical protein NTZ17_05980 [Phycisphaerae bacterium]|nr:hypothetical protein [Phycisphaerae bacterium]
MKIVTILLVGIVGWAVPTVQPAYSAESVGTAHPTASQPQDTQSRQVVIVVVGAAGTPEYATQFVAWAKLWEQACEKSNATFTPVGLDEPGPSSDLARIQQILADQSGETAAALWLVLIGHGTFDGRTAKFNLRGPDLSAKDLAEWLKPLHRPVAVIDTASASAPFLKELSSPGRIVITATKSGFEQNYARFGQYFAEAIIDPKADLDKDGQTSLLEAFLSASHATGQFYAGAGRLATEHALLDDNGDGLGTPAEWFRGIRPVQRARDGAALDGYHAHQLHLLSSPTEAALPPELRARRDQLELQVMDLRDNKTKYSEEEYFTKLEPLLREIAQIYEQAEKSGSPGKSQPQ